MHIRKDFCKNIFEKINLQSALLYSTKYSVSKIACCRGATFLVRAAYTLFSFCVLLMQHAFFQPQKEISH